MIHPAMALQVAKCVANCRPKFYFMQRYIKQKKIARQGLLYCAILVFSNLSHNGAALRGKLHKTLYNVKALLYYAFFLVTCLATALQHKLLRKLHSVAEPAVSQFFLFRAALHEVELGSTFRNALQQLATTLHSVSVLRQHS